MGAEPATAWATRTRPEPVALVRFVPSGTSRAGRTPEAKVTAQSWPPVFTFWTRVTLTGWPPAPARRPTAAATSAAVASRRNGPVLDAAAAPPLPLAGATRPSEKLPPSASPCTISCTTTAAAVPVSPELSTSSSGTLPASAPPRLSGSKVTDQVKPPMLSTAFETRTLSTPALESASRTPYWS